MRSLVIVLGLLVSACQPVALTRDRIGIVPITVRIDDVAYWLEEWHRVVQQPNEQIAQVLNLREKEFSDSPNPRSRLRLALLLAEGPASVRNQRRALKLLKELDNGQATEADRSLTGLLVQVINEQQWSNGRIGELRRNLEASDVKFEKLEQQLHELTNIEQSIQQRN